jgi:hypothetical protein
MTRVDEFVACRYGVDLVQAGRLPRSRACPGTGCEELSWRMHSWPAGAWVVTVSPGGGDRRGQLFSSRSDQSRGVHL